MAQRGKLDPRKRRRYGAAHTVIRLIEDHADQFEPVSYPGGVAAYSGSIGGSTGTTPEEVTFLSLLDTPGDYTGHSLEGVRVNATEDALEFYTASAATFISLTDTPAGYGSANQVPKSNGSSALAWGWVAWGELTGVPGTFPPDPHTHDWADLNDPLWLLDTGPTPDLVYVADPAADVAIGGIDDTAAFYFDTAAAYMYWGGSRSTAYPRGIFDNNNSLQTNASFQILVDQDVTPLAWNWGCYVQQTNTTDGFSQEGSGYFYSSNTLSPATIYGLSTIAETANVTAQGVFFLGAGSGLTFDFWGDYYSKIFIDDSAGSYQRGAVGVMGVSHYNAVLDNSAHSNAPVWDVESEGITRNNFCKLAVNVSTGIPPGQDTWLFTFSNGFSSPDMLNPLAISGDWFLIEGEVLSTPGVMLEVYVQPVHDAAFSTNTTVGGYVTYLVIDQATGNEVSVPYPGVAHHWNNITALMSYFKALSPAIPTISVLVRREYDAIL